MVASVQPREADSGGWRGGPRDAGAKRGGAGAGLVAGAEAGGLALAKRSGNAAAAGGLKPSHGWAHAGAKAAAPRAAVTG